MADFAGSFEIAGRRVGAGSPCLVVAEAGVNHFGDMGAAFRLVDLAVDAGADVFKIQHFKTDVLVGQRAPEWRERLRSKELGDDQVLAIRDYCERRGIVFMCTAHDEVALEFLDRRVGVPAFKVGSGEIGNWPSLERMAARGKPILLSTGMYEIGDVEAALAAIAKGGGREVAVLHCVTAYPADPGQINLGAMASIRSVFSGPIGYSDHTEGTAVPLAAVALGATVIEKHITLVRGVPNAQDWKVSCDPGNFAKFVEDIREIEKARGGGAKVRTPCEEASLRWARKSLTAVRDIAPGVVLTEEMIIAQRPGDGLSPHRIGEIVGRRVRVAIAAGTPISLEQLDDRTG